MKVRRHASACLEGKRTRAVTPHTGFIGASNRHNSDGRNNEARPSMRQRRAAGPSNRHARNIEARQDTSIRQPNYIPGQGRAARNVRPAEVEAAAHNIRLPLTRQKKHAYPQTTSHRLTGKEQAIYFSLFPSIPTEASLSPNRASFLQRWMQIDFHR